MITIFNIKNLNRFVGYYALLLVLTASVFFVSCQKEVLTKSPLDKFSDESVWKDAKLIETYVNNVYRSLPRGFEAPGGRQLQSTIDETHQRGREDYVIITSGNVTPSTPGIFENYWIGTLTLPSPNYTAPGYYSPITRANVFFANIEEAPIEEDIKNRMIGEMKVIRAYSYLRLISFYGGVPLITTPFSLTDDFNVPRSSYEECMAFIVKELQEATDLLPLEYDAANKGRVTKGAAMAILSRALLYDASPYYDRSVSNTDQAKWQKAAEAAKAVIDLGIYELFPDYKTLFLESEAYNSEIIWARPFNTEVDRETYVELSQYPNGYNGFGQVHPLHNIVDDYETLNGKLPKDDPTYDPQNPYANRDPRFYASILYDGAPFKGREVETFLPGGKDSNEGALSPHNATLTGYYERKFLDESITNPSSTNAGSTPWTYIRLAEIYLNYAEAMYNLGNEEVCREYINKIRKRPSVNMPEVTESGPALLARLQNERRIELAFEEHRYFDVRRWRIAPQVLSEDSERMTITKDASGKKTYKVETFQERNFNDRNYLMPIPQAEIEKNPLLVQNPGYENL